MLALAVLMLAEACALLVPGAAEPGRVDRAAVHYLPAQTALVVSTHDISALVDRLGYEHIASRLDDTRRAQLAGALLLPLTSKRIRVLLRNAFRPDVHGRIGIDVHGHAGLALIDADHLRWALFAQLTSKSRFIGFLHWITEALDERLDMTTRGTSTVLWLRGRSDVAVLLREGWAFVLLAPADTATDALDAALDMIALEPSRSLGASGRYQKTIARLQGRGQISAYLAAHESFWHMVWQRLIWPDAFSELEGVEELQERLAVLELAADDEEVADELDELRRTLQEIGEWSAYLMAQRLARKGLMTSLFGGINAVAALRIDVDRNGLRARLHIDTGEGGMMEDLFGAAGSTPIVRDALLSQPLALVEGQLEPWAVHSVIRDYLGLDEALLDERMESWNDMLGVDIQESLTGRFGVAITDEGTALATNRYELYPRFGFHVVLEVADGAQARTALDRVASRLRLKRQGSRVVATFERWKPLHVTVAGRYVIASTSRRILARLVAKRSYERRAAGTAVNREPSVHGLIHGSTVLRRLAWEYGQPGWGVAHFWEPRPDVPYSEDYLAKQREIEHLERITNDTWAWMWQHTLRGQAELDRRIGPINWAVTLQPWGVAIAIDQHIGDDSAGALIAFTWSLMRDWHQRWVEIGQGWEALHESRRKLEALRERDIELYDRQSAEP